MAEDSPPHDDDPMRLQKHIALGELGAGIVHEVRNLVTSIRGFAQIAMRRPDDAAQVMELLASIEKQSGHCVATLTRFLDYTQDGVGELRRVNVNDAVSGAEQLLRHHMQVHRIAFDVVLGDELPEVMGDTSLLQQVLVNLLLNAQQAMPGGGAVTMTSRASASHVELVVADDGAGVPAELLDSIFDTGFTTKSDGCGYGLPLCRDVMRRHDGEIEVRSTPGGGAVFTVRIPRAEPNDG